MATPTILVVDDEKINRDFVKLVFKDSGCKVLEASNGEEALEIIKKEKPDIVLLDIIMPGMLGFEVCKRIKRDPETADIPVIIVTALGDLDNKIKGFESGADEYITKPYEKNELLLRVKNMLKVKKYHDLLRDYSSILEREVIEKTKKLQEAYKRLDAAYLELIHRLGRAAEYRDDETGEHTKRVGKMCALMAEALDFDDHFRKNIEYASPLHDLGKIGIPDNILLKPGKLTKEEMEVIKKHTIIGADILSGSDHPVIVMAETIALTHHERWDGKGYPRGLKGEEIPIEGRICAIVDFFDACTSERVYRPAMDVETVVDMIKQEKGKHFDPSLVDIFLENLDKIVEMKFNLSKTHETEEEKSSGGKEDAKGL